MTRAPSVGPFLPAHVLADLQVAFADEISRRLPPLLHAAQRLADSDPEVVSLAVRRVLTEVHALGSSATVVGAEAASRAARECELLLVAYVDGTVPPEVTDKAGALARAVVRALARWTPDDPRPQSLPDQRPSQRSSDTEHGATA